MCVRLAALARFEELKCVIITNSQGIPAGTELIGSRRPPAVSRSCGGGACYEYQSGIIAGSVRLILLWFYVTPSRLTFPILRHRTGPFLYIPGICLTFMWEKIGLGDWGKGWNGGNCGWVGWVGGGWVPSVCCRYSMFRVLLTSRRNVVLSLCLYANITVKIWEFPLRFDYGDFFNIFFMIDKVGVDLEVRLCNRCGRILV